jgi:hypothetical protein
MIGGLPLGFAEPLVLIGLLTLPVLWWLLRLIPPRPRRIDFPPTRLLLEIAPREAETGERVMLIGDGFPPGKPAQIVFRGTLRRP